MAPSPPPPITPAIAEYPRTVEMFIAAPSSRDGAASGKIKWMIMYMGEAPIDKAASIIPGCTSLKEDSTILATIGIAPTVSGTMEAVVPMEDPVTNRVNGISSTRRIRNGRDRHILTAIPTAKFTYRLAMMPSFAVEYRMIPIGRPMI